MYKNLPNLVISALTADILSMEEQTKSFNFINIITSRRDFAFPCHFIFYGLFKVHYFLTCQSYLWLSLHNDLYQRKAEKSSFFSKNSPFWGGYGLVHYQSRMGKREGFIFLPSSLCGQVGIEGCYIFQSSCLLQHPMNTFHLHQSTHSL